MYKFLGLGLALILAVVAVQAEGQLKAAVPAVKELPVLVMEQSTESPIADMALIEDAPVLPMVNKSPTEKPPVVATPVVSAIEALPMPEQTEELKSAQPHTVADFIIHPLIAFKPRPAAGDELVQGKQAAGAATGTNTPGAWLFGMNPGQGIGSSFSTLAGSVSGWFNDRLTAAGQQLPALPNLPGLVDSPISTTSSTTTTQRPDIVVRVQQRPNKRRGNGNGNGNGNRLQRPNRFNNRLDSLESDEYDDGDFFDGNRFDEEFDDDEQYEEEAAPSDDGSVEPAEEEEDEQLEQKQKQKRRRPVQAQTQRRKTQSATQSQSQRRQQVQNTRRGHPAQQPLAQRQPIDDDEEDDDVEQDDDEEIDNNEESEENFAPSIFSQSSRRSQNQPGFLQNSQQNLINQFRRFTFGQTPAELGTKLRKSASSSQHPNRAGVRRPQQATLLVNRDGQTVYLAPELFGLNAGYPYGYAAAPVKKQQPQRLPVNAFPQGPVTVPVRRKGRPTQYITIPWSQLGLPSPDFQSQPILLNIPDSAFSALPIRPPTSSNQQNKKKKRPATATAAVPLLADASLVDLFQPPQIPPSRTGSSSALGNRVSKPKPVLIAAKPVQTGPGLLPTRIRPGTIVEKAPAVESAEKPVMMSQTQVGQQMEQQEAEMPETAAAATTGAAEMSAGNGQAIPEQEFIIVGDDTEPGVSRHVQPAYGDARYVAYGDYQPYYDLIHQNRRFALRKVGRALEPEQEQEEEQPESSVQV